MEDGRFESKDMKEALEFEFIDSIWLVMGLIYSVLVAAVIAEYLHDIRVAICLAFAVVCGRPLLVDSCL